MNFVDFDEASVLTGTNSLLDAEVEFAVAHHLPEAKLRKIRAYDRISEMTLRNCYTGGKNYYAAICCLQLRLRRRTMLPI